MPLRQFHSSDEQRKKSKLDFLGHGKLSKTSTGAVELESRRRAFWRANSDLYLPLLPPSNLVKSLLDGPLSKPTIQQDIVAYTSLSQPKLIKGGTEGLSAERTQFPRLAI